MKRDHPIATSLAAAAVAAVVVIAVYSIRKPQQQTATQNAEEAQTIQNAPKTISKPANPPPPPGRNNLPNKPPELPPSIRDGIKPPQLPDNLPPPEELREQFTLLRRFLELSPERLARIRESIERIERMPPERKKMMLERIQNVDPTASDSARRSHSPLADAPAEIRLLISKAIEEMPQESRNALMERLHDYTAEQRAAFFEGMAQGLSKDIQKANTLPPWNMPGGTNPFE